MSVSIKDGEGSGREAGVDGAKRLKTVSTTIDSAESATERKDSFNINSGLVTLTGVTERGVLYVKNNDARDLEVSSTVAILGPSTGGVTTDTTHVRIYLNPTTGTLISATLAANINRNRNAGSTQPVDVDAFKGSATATVTDGELYIESLVSPGSRVPFNIVTILPKGTSMAITYEPNDSNTSMKTMGAVICHLSDPNK